MRFLLWNSRPPGAPNDFASDRFDRRRCRGLQRRLSRSLVERRRNYLSLGFLAANFHVYRRPDRRQRRWHVGERDILAERWRRRAAGHHADGFAGFIAAAVAVARDPTLDHFQTDQR